VYDEHDVDMSLKQARGFMHLPSVCCATLTASDMQTPDLKPMNGCT
jgi:hypothetical protein